MRVVIFALVALVAVSSVSAAISYCPIGSALPSGKTLATSTNADCTCTVAPADYDPKATTQPNIFKASLDSGLHPTSTRFDNGDLVIVHDEYAKWYNGVQSDNNQPLPAKCRNYFTWTETAAPGGNGCIRRWEGRAAWSNVWQGYETDGTTRKADCNLKRNTVGNIVTFTFDFSWEHYQQVKASTGSGRELDAYERKVVQRMPFQIILPTEFSVTTTKEAIYAPVLLLAAVTKQEVVGTVPGVVSADIEVYTSLQFPFILTNQALPIIPSSVAPGTVTVSNVNSNAACTATGECQQRWGFNLKPANLSCNFNGDYKLDFTVACRTASTACPIDPATNYASFTFHLESSSHCAVIADSIELSADYDIFDNTNQLKTNFLDTQIVRFHLYIVSAKASIQSSKIKSAILYRAATKTAATWATGAGVGDGSITLVNNFAIESAPTAKLNIQLTDGGACVFGAARAAQSQPVLQMKIDSVYLGLTQDQIKPIVLVFNVFVQYQNAGQTATTNSAFEEQDEFGTSVVAVVAATGISGSGVSSTTSASATATPKVAGINAFAAAGALVAIVAVVAAVVVTGARVRANRIVQRYKVVEETATSEA